MSDHFLNLIYQEPQSQRLDIFLVNRLPDFSRSQILSLIQNGRVWINGISARKGGEKLVNQSTVQVHIPPKVPADLVPEPIPINIIFENDDLLVVNKPAGMVVHPAAGHLTGTLIHAVLNHAPEIEGIGGQQRPGVVHRLDKDTSGLIILAKNDRSHRWIQDQFKSRDVVKVYTALVDGKPPTPSGRVEASIGRDPKSRKKMAVVAPRKGRQAISEYQTLELFADHTLLEVHPITGRTHQIRLHLAFLGCPVCGDKVYGKKHPTIPISRQFLHAQRLKLRLPGEETYRIFEAPLPDELTKSLDYVRQFG